MVIDDFIHHHPVVIAAYEPNCPPLDFFNAVHAVFSTAFHITFKVTKLKL